MSRLIELAEKDGDFFSTHPAAGRYREIGQFCPLTMPLESRTRFSQARNTAARHRKGSAKVSRSESQWIVAHCQGTPRYTRGLSGCVGTIISEIVSARAKSKGSAKKVRDNDALRSMCQSPTLCPTSHVYAFTWTSLEWIQLWRAPPTWLSWHVSLHVFLIVDL